MTQPTNESAIERALLALEKMRRKLDAYERAQHEPIAIVGMSCRLGAGVASSDELWERLIGGTVLTGELPKERFEWSQHLHLAPSDPGERGRRYAATVEHHEDFDATYFQMSHREASRLDPQQRWLLEVTAEALEDGGLLTSELVGTRTAVFVGIQNTDLRDLVIRDLPSMDGHAVTGTSNCVAAGRLSHAFGFQGPSVNVDTACASSLVAVHLACQSLRSRETNLAVAAGVNAILSPSSNLTHSRLVALSPEGETRSFDLEASGHCRGEGCGVLVLKRLSDARRDRDVVRGVILGSAVAHAGRLAALGVPNSSIQEQTMHAALKASGVEPAAIGYVEAHGSASPVGDATELDALAAVYGERRSAPGALVVGSVKPNVGSLDAAGSVIGLIKTVLCLEQGIVPKHPSLTRVHPLVEKRGLTIPTEHWVWPAATDSPRRAAVCAYSIPGTNGHMIVESAPTDASPVRTMSLPSDAAASEEVFLLALSARSKRGLEELARRYVDFLRQEPPALNQVMASALQRRSVYDARLAVVGRDAQELVAALEQRRSTLRSELERGLDGGAPGKGGIAWVFTANTLSREQCDLLNAGEPIFAEAYERARRAIEEARLVEAHVDVEPLLAIEWDFCATIGLAELWLAWGAKPSAVVASGVGEVVASYVAGSLSLVDAARVVLAVAEPGHPVLASVEDIVSRPATLELYTATHGRVTAGTTLEVQSWERLSPERLPLGLLPQDRYDAVLLIGGTVLGSNDVERSVQRVSPSASIVSAVRQGVDVRRSLLLAVSALFERGCLGTLAQVVGDGHQAVRLPLVPWEHERIALVQPSTDSAPSHPIWGVARRVGGLTSSWLFRSRVSPERPNFLSERQIGGVVAIPMAVYFELCLTVARLSLGGARCEIKDLALLQDVELSQESSWTLQVAVAWDGLENGPNGMSSGTLSVWGYRNAATELDGATDEGRVELARAKLRALVEEPSEQFSSEARRCTSSVPLVTLVDDMMARGIIYGPTFQSISEVRVSGDFAVARLSAPSVVKRDEGAFAIHPALVEGCVQLLATLLPKKVAWVPKRVGHVAWYRDVPHGELLVHARVERTSPGECPKGSIELTDAEGALVASMEHVEFEPFGPHQPAWEPTHVESAFETCALPSAKPVQPGDFWLILGANSAERSELEQVLQMQGGTVCGAEFCEPAVAGETKMTDQDLAPSSDGLEYYRRFFSNAKKQGRRCRGIVDLFGWNADVGAGALPAGPGGSWESRATQLSAMVQAATSVFGAASPRLWLVSTGAQCHGLPSLASFPRRSWLWGVGRALVAAWSSVPLTLLDLDPRNGGANVAVLAGELASGAAEREVVYRGDRRLAVRFTSEQSEPEWHQTPTSDRPFSLEVGHPGLLNELHFTEVPRPLPRPGEVEIRVSAAGINFLDVLTALGVRPDTPLGKSALGQECAGTVSRIGLGVEAWKVGDPVVAFARGTLGKFVCTPASLVAPMPRDLDFATASALPVAYATAWYALVELARLEPGESVLIHAASGGLGLAAIAVARLRKAVVYATAGNEQKRAYLEQLGIEHVMDSRSLTFATKVRESTADRGVDVVLNCLTGAAIDEGLSLLAPYGRFVEVAKRDIYADRKVGLAPFRRNLSYFALDLARMLEEKPARVGETLRKVVELVDAKQLPALAMTVFDAGETAAAFRLMSAAKHVGKLAIRLDEAPSIIRSETPRELRGRGLVLVAGDSGPAGREMVRWLLAQGVEELALLNWRDEGLEGWLGELEGLGIRVELVSASGADSLALRRWVDARERGGHRLAGVVMVSNHSSRTSPIEVERDMSLAWALHEAMPDAAADFFVLMSSAASVLGSNRGVAVSCLHAFFDALAEHRRSLGLVGTSIGFGLWGGVTDAEDSAELSSMGMRSCSPTTDSQKLRHYWFDGNAAAVLLVDVDRWRWPSANASLCLSEAWDCWRDAPPDRLGGWVDLLANQSPEDCARSVMTHVCDLLSNVLRVPRERISVNSTFGSLGLDSLTGVEMRNRLENSLGLRLPATLLWTYTTPETLALRLLHDLGSKANGQARTAVPFADSTQQAALSPGGDVAALMQLSENELALQLARELESVGRTS